MGKKQDCKNSRIRDICTTFNTPKRTENPINIGGWCFEKEARDEPWDLNGQNGGGWWGGTGP